MIKATELRIGNLLFPTTKLPPHFRMAVKITAIGSPIESNYIFATGSHVADEDGFQPIHLTEEWLRRLGFKETAKGVFAKDILDFERLLQDDPRWGIHINEEDIGKEIQYVHQLQNLYFALTGEELTVSAFS